MRKSLSIILVAALATTSAFAAKPRYYGGSTAPKSYVVTKPAKDHTTAAEKKIAEEEGYDLKKMSARLKNEAKK